MRPWPAGLLSHGDKRKLELAMLLAGRPEVILLDEPMAGVSAEDVNGLVELIRAVHLRGRQDGADGRASDGGRDRARSEDRRHAPRCAARLRRARRGDGPRRRCRPRTWESPCERTGAADPGRRHARPPRRVARAPGGLVRGPRRRGDRPPRPQRRRQDDDAAGDDGARAAPRRRHAFGRGADDAAHARRSCAAGSATCRRTATSSRA